MSRNLTRKALYELVWAKPRTELAKQFNISDVALGKLCRQMNVPAPPPGYWAHIVAKGRGKVKFVRPPLTYTVAERIEEDHAEIRRSLPAFDPDKVDSPLPPPPSVAESQDEAVKRYVGLAQAVPLPKSSRGLHPVIVKLATEDDRLAAQATTYSWEQPKYKSSDGRQLFTGLNRLLWWWSDLGFEPSSSGIRHIRLYVSLGSYHQSFEICAKSGGQKAASKPRPSLHLFELRFDLDARYQRQKKKPDLQFSSFDTETFFATARLLIQRRETGFREWLRRDHEHMVWKRDDAIKKAHAATEAARQRSKAEREALVATRERAIDEALGGVSKSDELRALVNDLERRVHDKGGNGSTFALWKKWMLMKADALDIRTKSADALVEWVTDFRLSVADCS